MAEEETKAKKPAGKKVAVSVTVRKPDGTSKLFSAGDTMPKEWAEHCTNPVVFGS